MKTFVISQKKWLRGEGSDKSYLLRPSDGKMCCIGQVGEQCGIPEIVLVNRREISELERADNKYPKKLALHTHLHNFYTVNDDPSISDTWRKTQLRRLAKLAGFRFKFVR